MKRILIAAVLPLVLFGCKPKPGSGEYAKGVYPYDLELQVDNGTIELAWKKRGQANISGYNIYITDESLAARYSDDNISGELKPFNQDVFPGDTEPEDGVEHFTAEGLTNGVKYFVSVRVVYPDQTLSSPTNELTAVPAPTGEIELSVRYGGQNDGYCFFQDKFVGADHVDNDVYYYSRQGQHFLASPTRLDGFLRDSKLMLLPLKGDYIEIRKKVSQGGYSPTEDRVEVSSGDWVLLRTADSRHVLIQVQELSPDGGKAALFFAVSGLKEDIFF